ncbi:BTB/POZ protein [Lasiosphaeria hispida]|uniref:BTB/POZ protein n=1 Tax=Lasiosphaeria hispida TaxID=260671 RepID=A0AAJ0HD80_9PEZI|nr:BTB/POZ protein [Lasiosphaeria hispida]
MALPARTKDSGQAPNICSTEEVVLNVGGYLFTTTIGTLVGRSEYFAAFFSGRWAVHKRPDGAIFVDADPDVFAHILRYLRRGLYVDLLPEAKYFQVPMLERWLEDELYLKCAEHTSIWKHLSDSGLGTESWSSNPGVQLVKRSTTVASHYVCPMTLLNEAHSGIYDHGTMCELPKEGMFNRTEKTDWAEYGTKATFHPGWCSDRLVFRSTLGYVQQLTR